MPVCEFVGHIALHWQGEEWSLNLENSHDKLVSRCFLEKCTAQDAVVVLEYGTENGHAHFHYWLRTAKAKGTVIAAIKAVFVPPGKAAPAQYFSCKVAKQEKMSEYFRYLAKGPHAEKGVQPLVVLDVSGCRMWEELHDAFHAQAEAMADAKKKGKTGFEFYELLAGRCREKGAQSRDDVLEVVTRYYVYESKKGFDKFAVTRVFWGVWALVNAEDCHACLLEECRRAVAP